MAGGLCHSPARGLCAGRLRPARRFPSLLLSAASGLPVQACQRDRERGRRAPTCRIVGCGHPAHNECGQHPALSTLLPPTARMARHVTATGRSVRPPPHHGCRPLSRSPSRPFPSLAASLAGPPGGPLPRPPRRSAFAAASQMPPPHKAGEQRPPARARGTAAADNGNGLYGTRGPRSGEPRLAQDALGGQEGETGHCGATRACAVFLARMAVSHAARRMQGGPEDSTRSSRIVLAVWNP